MNPVVVDNTHARTAMVADWQPVEPDDSATAAAVFVAHSAAVVAEFVSYWLLRPEVVLTPAQWQHKYIQRLAAIVANDEARHGGFDLAAILPPGVGE